MILELDGFKNPNKTQFHDNSLGLNEPTLAEVSVCYTTGNITATLKESADDKDVGGFIVNTGGLIENCYSRGNVSTTGNGAPEAGVFIANLESWQRFNIATPPEITLQLWENTVLYMPIMVLLK